MINAKVNFEKELLTAKILLYLVSSLEYDTFLNMSTRNVSFRVQFEF
jgi:hypothetical protein